LFFESEISKYRKWRSVGLELVNNRIYKGLPKEYILEAAKDLRILKNEIIVFGENDTNYLPDRAIYDIERNGEFWIDQYIKTLGSSLTRKEYKFAEAMKDSFYSLFFINDSEEGKLLHVMDVFSGEKYRIMDINLSQSDMESGFLLSARILSIDGINFASGASCIFRKEHLAELKKNFTELYEKKKNEMSWQKMMRKYSFYFYLMAKKYNKKKVYTDTGTSL